MSLINLRKFLEKRAGKDNSQFFPDEVPDYMNASDRNWWGNNMYQYNLTPEQDLPRNTRGEPHLEGRKRSSDYLLGPEGAGGTSQPLEENAGQQNYDIDPQAKRRYDQQQQMGMNYPPGHPNRGRDQGYLGQSYYRKQPRLRQDPHLPFDTGFNPVSDTYPMYSEGQERPYTPLPFRGNNMGDWYPKHEGDEGPYSSIDMHDYRRKVGKANAGVGEHPTFKEHIDAWAQAGLEDTNGWWFGHVPHNPDIHPEDYHEALQTPTSIHDFLPLIRNSGIQAMPYGTSLPKHYKRGQGQGGMTFEQWTKTLLDSHEGDDYWGTRGLGKNVQKLMKFVQKDVSRFTPEELNQLEADEGVRFNREALKTSRGAIPQAGRQARPYARTVGVDPDAGLSTHAYGADEAVGPMGERRYAGKGMRAEFPSWAQDYGPTPQEWNAISQPDTPEERWSREKRIGMMSRFPQVPPNDGPDNPDDEERSYSYSPAEWARNNPRKAVQKLMKFAQLQKIGYPDPQQPYPKGFNMNQSAGLPEPGSKEGQRIGEIAQKVDPYRFNEGGSPLHAAHSYIRRLQEDTSGKDLNFGDHLAGHDAIANVHNIMNFGEEYAHHPDAIKYKLEEPELFGGNTVGGEDYWGYAEDADLNTPMSLELFHGRFVNNNIHPDTSQQAVGMADQLHQRLRQVSPDRLYGSVGSDLLRRNPRFPKNAESSARLYRQRQYPGSYAPSYYESYPLPPTGEQEGKLGPGERTITHRWFDRDDEDLPPEARSKRKRDLFEYQSARARRASRKLPEDEEEEENISSPPSKAKNAFEQRFPDLFRDKEKAVAKLMKFLRKEGDGGGEGGAFNGLSGTVFTSTNAGIFTPTYGGQKTKRKHSKRRKAQEKKRKKLLGKEKKSGVDRLVQFLYDGSPVSKSRKPNKDMTGNAATAHAWNNKSTGRKILDWQKKAEDNQPNANMGQAGGMETGTTATYPRHENINSVGNGTTQRAPDWGKHQSYLQKLSSDGSVTMVSPTENDPATGPHPQRPFVERTKDNPNEPPQKDAVVKENDMEKRIKSYDNKEEDTGHEQPRGAGAVAGMGNYPSGATMQMAMTAGGINPDALERGGEKDIEDPEVTEEETPGYWIPEAEKRLTAMKKELEEAGDANPILNTLLKVDYA